MTLARPDAPPGRTRPRGAKILLALGVLLLVVGVVVGRSGVERVERTVTDLRNSGDDVRNGLLLELTVPGDEEVDLEPGRYDVFALYTLGSTGFRPPTSTTSSPVVTDGSGTTPADDDEDFDEPEVTVTGPDGQALVLREPSIEAIFTGASGQLYAVHSFRVDVAGTHSVSATGGEADKVGVGPTLDDGRIGQLVTDGALTLVGFLGAGLGFVLAAAGGIWFLVGGKPPRPPAAWGPATAGPMPAPGWGGPAHRPAQTAWGGPAPGWAPPTPAPPGAATRPPPPVPMQPTAPTPGGPSGPVGPRPPTTTERPWGVAPPEHEGPPAWRPPQWTPPTWSPPGPDGDDQRA